MIVKAPEDVRTVMPAEGSTQHPPMLVAEEGGIFPYEYVCKKLGAPDAIAADLDSERRMNPLVHIVMEPIEHLPDGEEIVAIYERRDK